MVLFGIKKDRALFSVLKCHFGFATFFGSCTKMIAANMIIQPIISRPLMDSLSNITPAMRANTDYMLRSSDAMAGSVYF